MSRGRSVLRSPPSPIPRHLFILFCLPSIGPLSSSLYSVSCLSVLDWALSLRWEYLAGSPFFQVAVFWPRFAGSWNLGSSFFFFNRLPDFLCSLFVVLPFPFQCGKSSCGFFLRFDLTYSQILPASPRLV